MNYTEDTEYLIIDKPMSELRDLSCSTKLISLKYFNCGFTKQIAWKFQNLTLWVATPSSTFCK